MPVPSAITDLSQTAGSNYPAGSESPNTADDYFRAHASFIAMLRDGEGFSAEATVASAGTTDIGDANSLYVQVTGTTTITSLGANYKGPRLVRFAGALTLTHNATTLVLPGGVNITTAAGDVALFVPNANPATGWRLGSYLKGDGTGLFYGISITGNTTIGDAAGDTLTIAPSAVTWSNNPTHSGDHTFSGNVTVNGNTVIGNASGDTLTIAPNAITWSNNPTHSGNHTFSGNVTFGDATTDTTTVSGYMGVGGAGNSGRAINIVSTALTGTAQFGIYSTPTNSAGGTSQLTTCYSAPIAANNVTTVRHYYVDNATGAGTVTTQVGLDVLDLTKGSSENIGVRLALTSGASKWNIYASGTAANHFSGDVMVFGAGGLGYTTGSGGAVTQITSRTTGVTLNKTNGAITLVSAAGTTTWQSFTVTNSTVAATDTVIVVQKSGTDLYEIHVTAVAAGSFRITYRTTAGTTTEQPVFNFSVIKAVAA